MKSLRAGCDDGMNMISHGQAASNGYSKDFKRGRTRDTRNGRRKVAVSFLFLSTKMTSTVLLRLTVKLLSFDHDSMCSISANRVWELLAGIIMLLSHHRG